MANPCAPNSSEPKPGLGTTLTYNIEQLVNYLIDQEMSWLAPFAGRSGPTSFDLPSFCAADPPPVPEQDPTVIVTYFSPLNPNAGRQLTDYLHSVIDYRTWYTCCQCSAGAQPTPVAPTPQPPGLNTNPPDTAPPAAATCRTGRVFESISDPGPPHNDILFPFGTGTPLSGQNATSVVVTPSYGSPTGALSATVAVHAVQTVGNDLVLASWSVTQATLTIPAMTLTVPANTTNITENITYTGGTGSLQELTEYALYCGGTGPGGSANCCPPDPAIMSTLSQVLELLNELLSLQPLEGAYQDTIVHSGLNGNGTIAINPASSAIRVDVQTDLANWPHNIQTPTYFYSLGFVTPFAVGTPLKGQRLVYNHQTFSWPTYTDTIGYSISPGVTVNLVELTRGA